MESIFRPVIRLIKKIVGVDYLISYITSITNPIYEQQIAQATNLNRSTQKLEDNTSQTLEILSRINPKETVVTANLQTLTQSKNDVVNDSNDQEESKDTKNDRLDLIIPNAKLGRSIISCQDGTRFDVIGNFELFARIIEDMRLNGKNLAPSGVWSEYSVQTSFVSSNRDNVKQDELYNVFSSRFSTLKQMLDPWIGQVGMQPVNSEQVTAYLPLLKKIDSCGLLGDDLYTTAAKQNMLNTDLGSMMDVNLIADMLPFEAGERYSILEVGGGYGRLAEALTNGIDSRFHYVLVDAVPGSLMYAKEYIQKAFPNKRIGFYLDDIYDVSYDFYILPPWHLSRISNTVFDVAINVESMQEMEQQHVDFYLSLFNELVKEDGLIYISNSRAYHFKGTWNFPEKWRILSYQNTPRSWTNDHPTVIFRKTDENNKMHNCIIEGLYIQQINDWNLKQEIASLKNEISWRDDELEYYREKKNK